MMEAHDSEGAPQQSEATPPTEAPQLNDALQSLNAQMAELTREVRSNPDGAEPEGEEPEEYEGEAQPAWDEFPDEMSEGDLRTAMREEALAAIQPYAIHNERRELQRENQRREREIRAMAENEYPRLKEPEVVAAVAASLERLAEMTGDKTVRTNPEAVRMAYQAYEAQAQAAGETPVGGGGRGARLESGAGPGPAPSDVDPVEQQYTDAITGQVGKDPLTS